MSNEDDNMSTTSSERCEPSKLRKHNHTFLRSLYDREINGNRTNIFRTTYQTVYPNCSILNVKTPTPYLRKFLPDGRHFLAFSSDLASVEIYDYFGCSVAFDLLKNYKEDIIDSDTIVGGTLDNLFEKLFKLKYSIRVTPLPWEKLVRTCSLFTENGHYAVVGSSFLLKNIPVPFSEIYSSNEAVTPTCRNPLENYTIYLINLRLGYVSHTLQFKLDKINLNHNEGIYLYNNTMAILSQQHQTIYIYNIIQDHFNLLRKIGQYCHENDHNLISSVYPYMNSSTYSPYRECCINGLKHKLMVFLFNKAKCKRDRLEFHNNFDDLLSYRMWKMQLLDENHLLIRYAPVTAIRLQLSSPFLEVSYFMVYDMATNKVVDIFENKSDELLKLYENFCDDFRHSFSNPEGCIPSSISNSLYSWETHQDTKDMVVNEFNGTETLNKLVMRRLPIAAQSFNSSPYLDTEIYRYDEKWVSAMESPKEKCHHSIGFYSRKSGSPCFYLNTGKVKQPSDALHRLVEFVFHPSEPFALSVVKENPSFVINFHIHKTYMPE